MSPGGICPNHEPWSEHFIVDGCLHYGWMSGLCSCEKSPHFEQLCPSKGKREVLREEK